ncbi:MAG: rhodanese-like domain-containing protein [Gammaproteobacteria bacterium]|nr:rhodanese-like domain-containing protein [Gammaproteobacteria bacterium]
MRYNLTMYRAILFPLVLLLLCGPLQAEQYKGFPRGHTLVTAAEVKSMLDGQGPKPVVLAAVKQVSWLLEHIPGALHAPRKAYTGKAGMAVNRERFQEFARELGIDNDSTVVVYDDAYDAARLWWLFRLYGKPDVRVLDGGLDAWKDAGYNVERGPGRSAGKTGNFIATPALAGWTADMADVHQGRSDAATHVWDARAPAEWDGSRSIGGLPAGRIGWARYIGWKDFRKASEGRPSEFRTAAEISELLMQAGFERGHDHIFYCHSGVRAATPLFALYLMGFPVERLHLYDGSWIEWSRRALKEGAGSP